MGFEDSSTLRILKKISIFGGPAVTVTEAPGIVAGATWAANDQIIFGGRGFGLFRMSAGGGDAMPLTTLDTGEAGHLWPSLIPGRGAVVFVISAGNPLADGQLAVLDLETGKVTHLNLAGVSPRYVSTGHLVYAASDGSLRAVPFDAASLTVTGSPVPLVEGVRVKAGGGADFSISDSGRLVYVTGAEGLGAPRSLVWVDRDGREAPLEDWPQDQYVSPRLSPDGTRLAVIIAESADLATNPADLWVLDLDRGARTRLTFGGNNRFFPVWSPDGTRLAFADFDAAGQPNRLMTAPADGSGEANTLLEGLPQQFVTAWAPDGKGLAIYLNNTAAGTARDLAVLPLDGDRTPVPFLSTPFEEKAGMFSPDGRYLAYVSNESGQQEVYVRPYPSPGHVTTISTAGGNEPAWSQTGHELFFRHDDEMLAVPVDAKREFRAGTPHVLFTGDYALDNSGGGGGVANYTVTPDGQRFLMVKPHGDASQANPSITVVLSWFEELKASVPTK